jgi:hypothetical protein
LDEFQHKEEEKRRRKEGRKKESEEEMRSKRRFFSLSLLTFSFFLFLNRDHLLKKTFFR